MPPQQEFVLVWRFEVRSITFFLARVKLRQYFNKECCRRRTSRPEDKRCAFAHCFCSSGFCLPPGRLPPPTNNERSPTNASAALAVDGCCFGCEGAGAENVRRAAGGPALGSVAPHVRLRAAGVGLQPEDRPPARAGRFAEHDEARARTGLQLVFLGARRGSLVSEEVVGFFKVFLVCVARSESLFLSRRCDCSIQDPAGRKAAGCFFGCLVRAQATTTE